MGVIRLFAAASIGLASTLATAADPDQAIRQDCKERTDNGTLSILLTLLPWWVSWRLDTMLPPWLSTIRVL